MKNFNCLLIHTPRLQKENNSLVATINYSAMGLFSLAGELVRAGFDTKILHLGIEKYLDKNFLLSDYIKRNNIKFAAFTLQWFHQSYDVIETARVLKEKCPDIFISLGGYTSSFYAKEILEKFPQIDAVIKGDGEIPIVKLAQALNKNTSLEEVPNLFWRKDKNIVLNKELYVASSEDLDKFEFFNSKRMMHYDEYSNIGYYMNFSEENQLVTPSTSLVLTLGRGCLGNCVWCGGGFKSSKIVSGRDCVSYRNADKVIAEIKEMREKFNLHIFRIGFDPNDKDRSYLINLLNKIKHEFNKEITVMFDSEGLPDEKFIRVYKDSVSNDSMLSITAVSENEKIRKRYKSFYFSNKNLEERLAYLEKLEIPTELYFSNIPGINDEENKKSKEYGEYLKSKYKCITESYIYDMEIVPASLWTLNPEKYNLKDANKCFMDYYNDTKGLKNSFETDEFYNINR